MSERFARTAVRKPLGVYSHRDCTRIQIYVLQVYTGIYTSVYRDTSPVHSNIHFPVWRCTCTHREQGATIAMFQAGVTDWAEIVLLSTRTKHGLHHCACKQEAYSRGRALLK